MFLWTIRIHAHFALPSHQAILNQFNSCSVRFVFPKETKTIDNFKSLLTDLSIHKSQHFTTLVEIFVNYQQQIAKSYKYNRNQNLDTHYSTCSTIFFFQSENWFEFSAELRTAILHDLLANSSAHEYREDPKLIAYISISNRVDETDYNGLHKTGVSSKFYLLTPSQGYKLCIHCEKKLYPADETTAWRELYKSKLGKIPMEYSIGHRVSFQSNCEVSEVYNLRNSFRANGAEYCLLHELSKEFNLTGRQDRVEYNKFALLYGKYTKMNDWTKPRKWLDRFIVPAEFTQTGMFINSYEFGSIISPTIRVTEILLGPLDTYSWIILSTSLLCLSIFVGIVTQSFYQAFNVWSILLEQGTFMTGKFKGSKYNIRTLVSISATVLWTFMALVISNGYKGQLSSSMTSPGLVTCPRSLEELVNSESMLFSTGGAIQTKIDSILLTEKNIGLKTKARYSKLKERLRVLRNYGIYIPYKGNKDWHYSYFYHGMVFVSPMELITSMVNKRLMKIKGENLTIPTTVINYLDIKKKIDLAHVFSTVYTKYIFKYGGQVFIAPNAHQWVFKRSYFKWYSKHFFQGIDNSGIHSRWVFYYDVRSKLELLQTLNTSEQLEATAENRTRKRQPIKISPISLFFNNKIRSTFVDYENRGKALPLQVFFVFLLLFGYTILVDIFAFVAEIAWVKVRGFTHPADLTVKLRILNKLLNLSNNFFYWLTKQVHVLKQKIIFCIFNLYSSTYALIMLILQFK